MSPEEFYEQTVPEPNTGCILWTGYIDHEGYGLGGGGNHKWRAHRYAFKLRHGDWPKNCALHKCDTRACVNPDHLFDGTRSENAADRDRKGRTYKRTACMRGHPYAEHGVVDAAGARRCSLCRVAEQRACKARKRVR